MKRWVCLSLGLLLVLIAARAMGLPRRAVLSRIADAIAELSLERADEMIAQVSSASPALSFERARLAIYRGDCDTAWAILSSPTYSSTEEGAALGRLARSCAGATAAAMVVEDEHRGVWVRLQDEGDRVLVPFVVRVATRARDSLQRELGVRLPRPLRIDLVRDVFSLSAVTGLPVRAAETTGTIAVARWGRVAMITPRAMAHGYPWEDTLAHEITHLFVTRASRDRAPLWLQEGIAKLQEIRWRSERPFDDTPYDEIALTALLAGHSVGIEQLGSSIAMLPSADAARIAFAEVTSFVGFWIRHNGVPALWLLLADMKGLGHGSADVAMRSVTGYGLAYWSQRWKQYLVADGAAGPPSVVTRLSSARSPAGARFDASDQQVRETVRRVRLGDMLFERSHSAAAAGQFDRALTSAPREAAVRWRAARSQLDVGESAQAGARLGDFSQIDSNHGPWLAIRGRLRRAGGEKEKAERAFSLAIAVDPLSEDVACEGYWARRSDAGQGDAAPHLPASPERRALCQAARELGAQD